MLRIAVDSDFGLRKVRKKKWKVTTGHFHYDFVARFEDMIDTKGGEIDFVRRVECGGVIFKRASRHKANFSAGRLFQDLHVIIGVRVRG